MSRIVHIICCWALGSATCSAWGQTSTAYDSSKNAYLNRIAAVQRYNSLEMCVLNYRRFAALRDSTGKVSEESMYQFEQLFDNNAKVINDLVAEPPQVIDMRDYVTLAYSHLYDSGVNCYLKDLQYANTPPEKLPYKVDSSDTSGKRYQYELKMTKVLLNGYNAAGEVVWHPKGREYKIIMFINIDQTTLEARISRIVSDETVNPPPALKDQIKKNK